MGRESDGIWLCVFVCVLGVPLLHLYVVLEGEDIIELEYCMSELVDKALGQRIEPASLDLTAETVNP